MKNMDWQYMVIRRYFQDGRYEGLIIQRKDFHGEDHPDNKAYQQEFYPCMDSE